VISIPIAIKYLGKEGFVAYTALYALSLAPQALVLRHGPALTGPSAILFAKQQWQQIREKLWSAVTPSGASALIAGAGLLVFLLFGWIDIPAALDGVSRQTLLATLAVLVVVNLLNTWVLVFDDMQAAFQETHVQGIRVTLGNIVALLAIIFIIPRWPSLLLYAVAITVPPIAFRVANVGLLMVRYRQIIPTAGSVNSQLIKQAIRNSFMYTLVVGLGNYASFRLPVIASAEFLSVDQTTSISIINQFVLVGYVFGSVLGVAFVPAINATIADGNSKWVHRSVRRLEFLLLAASILGIIAFYLLGPIVHRYFVKESLHVSTNCLLFAGIYTALLVIENFYYLVTFSFSPSVRLSVLYVVRTLITGVFAFIACAADFPAGIWISGSVLTIMMTIFAYRFAVFDHLRRVTSENEVEDQASLPIATATD
tara:strand:+ start:140889 stop:142166 length:1278 start_codon:yes stop_codon:yes gene_type:complete